MVSSSLRSHWITWFLLTLQGEVTVVGILIPYCPRMALGTGAVTDVPSDDHLRCIFVSIAASCSCQETYKESPEWIVAENLRISCSAFLFHSLKIWIFFRILWCGVKIWNVHQHIVVTSDCRNKPSVVMQTTWISDSKFAYFQKSLSQSLWTLGSPHVAHLLLGLCSSGIFSKSPFCLDEIPSVNWQIGLLRVTSHHWPADWISW